ncbi:ABC transporter ATP-binding protein [Sulfurimonas sp. CVO]|jgi:iron complex transport system ATP-binding protein|uniref:ABC transporter ATP-binding protein n=1 Tax=Sulfurimonas xiamenensis TaxID=2590021 RepID=A0AAJ4A236_9BACT|nr:MULTISPECIES: ABC transporter ATP-binding protein [Sulfurimonas]PLY13727.1 MAG: ABC transporter ATP-binding protein [Sulfurimonas sp.]QFR42477.1 ABC transporter ATP-binding protein [Sulfurimonas xiamenensis]QHG91946.1 ABC transporter ATP-binding protein [Sulfurimonas sp. CVO]
MIELKSLSCSYGSNIILQDINMEIESHLSILGANGSGKSTLVRAICALVSYGGEIYIDGVDAKELSLLEMAKTISYIPAKLEIYDSFITVKDFVLLGRFAYKKNFFEYSHEDRVIAAQKIKLLGLEHLKEHTLASLSSGEQQLSLIAAALAQESKIIIFDEPTANLDPHNSKVIAHYIKKLKETHQVILITHDLHLACYIDNPIAFIKEKKAHLYGRDFFDDEVLKELWGVEFFSLAVKYG